MPGLNRAVSVTVAEGGLPEGVSWFVCRAIPSIYHQRVTGLPPALTRAAVRVAGIPAAAVLSRITGGEQITESSGTTADSNAPMSTRPPAGRATPRWSVLGKSTPGPAFNARLPGKSAWVGRLLPFSARGPRHKSSAVRPIWSVKSSDQRLVTTEADQIIPERSHPGCVLDINTWALWAAYIARHDAITKPNLAVRGGRKTTPVHQATGKTGVIAHHRATLQPRPSRVAIAMNGTTAIPGPIAAECAVREQERAIVINSGAFAAKTSAAISNKRAIDRLDRAPPITQTTPAQIAGLGTIVADDTIAQR